MKRILVADELTFPVYFLAQPQFEIQGVSVDVPYELVQEYEAAGQAFQAVQEKLGVLYKQVVTDV